MADKTNEHPKTPEQERLEKKRQLSEDEEKRRELEEEESIRTTLPAELTQADREGAGSLHRPFATLNDSRGTEPDTPLGHMPR